MRIKILLLGRPIGEQGFTLLELLVVLVIIGVALSSIQGFIPREMTALTLDQTANAIANSLRDVRRQAIGMNRDSLFLLDVEKREYRSSSNPKLEQIDDDIFLQLITARIEQSGQKSGRIRFFGDGSSTGGQIILRYNNRRREVSVDWLTGAISITSDES